MERLRDSLAILALFVVTTVAGPAKAGAPARVRRIVDGVTRIVPGPAPRLTLSGHSGGGSFIFQYLDGGEAIPPDVARIAFLDANYSYADDAHHGDKLLAWLRGDAGRQ